MRMYAMYPLLRFLPSSLPAQLHILHTLHTTDNNNYNQRRHKTPDSPERVGGVVDEDDVLQVAAEHGEVFQKVPVDAEARVPVQAVLDPLPLRVKDVQQFLRVPVV